MVSENLGEREFERYVLEDDMYTGEIETISDIYESTNYNGKTVEKLRFGIGLESKEHGRVVLPLFMTATVSDAGEWILSNFG